METALSSGSRLAALPHDALRCCFAALDARSLATAAAVCHLWAKVAREDAPWRAIACRSFRCDERLLRAVTACGTSRLGAPAPANPLAHDQHPRDSIAAAMVRDCGVMHAAVGINGHCIALLVLLPLVTVLCRHTPQLRTSLCLPPSTLYSIQRVAGVCS